MEGNIQDAGVSIKGLLCTVSMVNILRGGKKEQMTHTVMSNSVETSFPTLSSLSLYPTLLLIFCLLTMSCLSPLQLASTPPPLLPELSGKLPFNALIF